jgi:hypothetical protein
MSAPIRCEPFAPEAAALQNPASTLSRSSSLPECPGRPGTPFNDFLSTHLTAEKREETDEPSSKTESREEKDKDSKGKKDRDTAQVQPWTVLGIAPVLLAIPPQKLEAGTAVSVGTEGKSEAGVGSASNSPEPGGQALPGIGALLKENGPKDAAAGRDSIAQGKTGKDAASAAEESGNLFKMLGQREKEVNGGKQKLPAAVPSDRKDSEQFAEKGVKKAGLPGGIPVAQEHPMPLTSAKVDETTSASEQQRQSIDLASFDAPAFDQAISSIEALDRHAKPEGHDSSAADLSVNFLTVDSKPHLAESAGVSETQIVSPVHAPSVIDAIRDHVQVLRTSSHDRLEVMLQPDAQTQLLIHVSKVDGQIEVRARCERGDFQALNEHWNAVRGSLEAQGIRVQPLLSSNQQFTSDFRHQQERAPHSDLNQDQGRDRSGRSPSSSQSPRPASTLAPAAPRSARVRGWQSWA